MNKENLSDNKDDTKATERSSARRTKRGSGRSSTLRRKTSTATKTPNLQDKKKSEKKEAPKSSPPAKKQRRTPSKGVAMKKSGARKKSEPVAVKKSKRTQKDEDEFELRSLPDGTLFRVKVEEKKKTSPKTGARRKRKSGDSGPGPAIVDLIPANGLTDSAKQKGINIEPIIKATKRSCAFLKRRLSVTPKVAVILGSGLSSVGELINDDSPVEMGDIPGFVSPQSPGHTGLLRSGHLDGVPTLFVEGRSHFYETGSMADTVFAVQTFMALGVDRLILTTSAGAINPDYNIGDILFIEDQINLMGDNPLIGMYAKSDSEVFIDPSNIYHKGVLSTAERLCRRARVTFRRGVLAGVSGPFYETGAERRMLGRLGADAVSTSIIPEAIAAAQVGVSVVALGVITRKGEPKTRATPRADAIITGKQSATGLKRLVTSIVANEW